MCRINTCILCRNWIVRPQWLRGHILHRGGKAEKLDSKSTLYLTVFDGSCVLEFWTKAICRIIVSNGLCGVDLTNGFVKEGSSIAVRQRNSR
jgi:hypothetical protein